MSIRQRIISIIMTLFVTITLIAGILSWSLNDLRIGGKVYDQIVMDKDLIADILPPPEYVIESYLTVYQLLDNNHPDKAALWQSLDKLYNEYEQRKQFWQQQPLPNHLQQQLALSQQQADRFYDAIKALKQHPADESTRDIIQSIHQAYGQHRQAVDALVAEANKHFEQTSQIAEHSLSYDIRSILLVILLVIALSFWQSWLTYRNIMQPVAQLNKVMDRMSAGDFSIRTTLTGRDELSNVADNLNHLCSHLQRLFQQSIEASKTFSHGEFGKQIAEDFPGEMGQLAATLNHSFTQTEASAAMVISAMHALRTGMLLENWPGKGKSTQFYGKWQEAIHDGEMALLTRETVFKAIIQVMETAATGDFSQRAQVKASGLFERAMIAINDTMSQLEIVITEINQVTTAQSRGDLSQHVLTQADGQLLLMKESINHSISRMQQVVEQIAHSSDVVSNVSTQVSHSAHNLSSRIQEQAIALEKTTASIQEMAHAVQRNDESAQTATQLINNMQHKANNSMDIMKQTIDAMSDINTSSHHIADIVGLIDSIAFQTNLLALNAAVEAARAGEHGRGFAVVASEVRGLAQKSSEAAKEIRTLIEESLKRATIGSTLANKSGDMLHEIMHEITAFSQTMIKIAAASAEQTEGISEVNRSIARIEQASQENATLVKETTTATEHLSTEAGRLREQVNFFSLASSQHTQPLTLTQLP